MANRPPRLDQIFPIYDPPLYFITFVTRDRTPLLACDALHGRFCSFAVEAARRHICVGRYVLMPDHIHLFVSGPCDFSLPSWVRLLKLTLSGAMDVPGPHWQQGFFDHLLRHSESYAEKWEYVRQNPVRAGLVPTAEKWPYQGEITPLPYD
jgi:REP element-mobilizing transposase RayT